MKPNVVLYTFILLSAMASCTYETIEPKEQEVPTDISFNDNVIPIFNGVCNNSGCHSSGGIPPNLTPGNAFIGLTFFGYIDIDAPEESEIYKKITTGSMEEYATDQDRAIILKWIEQGALDN
ncbi:MAG: hypothetical protein RIF39_15115 [Cyclobacteriaceae bacterium]